jgi:hypothetical protein
MAPGAGLLASEREWARAVVVQCGGAVMAEAAEALRDHSGTQNEKCGQSSEKDQTQQHQMRRVPKASPQSMSFPGRSFLLTVRPNTMPQILSDTHIRTPAQRRSPAIHDFKPPPQRNPLLQKAASSGNKILGFY